MSARDDQHAALLECDRAAVVKDREPVSKGAVCAVATDLSFALLALR